MRHLGPVHARRDAAYRLPRKSLTELIMEYMSTLLGVILVLAFYFRVLFEVFMSRVTWDLDQRTIMFFGFAAFFCFILGCHQTTADKLIALPDDLRDRVDVGFASRLRKVVMVMSYVVMAMYVFTGCILFYAVFFVRV